MTAEDLAASSEPIFGWFDWVSILSYFIVLFLITVKVSRDQALHVSTGER